ncbi:hypothetical protein MGG_16101 [Pyricularia oryzae 70-15]|uniref:Uncharacterized protein n=1 Tax=Pyricularia oryzae (strain 70-15 / ATCC MYA-4617 / FGSC 8958) TaxID=242507 RepID=G4MQK1_PYRO7|nr:uncharacterized protein MGG_16101 [Pyricularia oryzae 70-15]EHA56491.1 hypothetical protein MGG_16101 [Pyricularia oryzae 70-15]
MPPALEQILILSVTKHSPLLWWLGKLGEGYADKFGGKGGIFTATTIPVPSIGVDQCNSAARTRIPDTIMHVRNTS